LCYQSALRRVIHECTGTPFLPLPSNIERANYGLLKLQKIASLFDIIDNISDPLKVTVSEHPLYMELIGQVWIQPSYFLSFFVTEPIKLVTFDISTMVFVLFQMYGFLLYMSEYQGKHPYSNLLISKVLAFIFHFLAMEKLIISEM
jgi:beta-galactosidase